MRRRGTRKSDDEEKKTCPHCRKEFEERGIARHEAACAAEYADAQADLEILRLLAREEQKAKKARSRRTRRENTLLQQGLAFAAIVEDPPSSPQQELDAELPPEEPPRSFSSPSTSASEDPPQSAPTPHKAKYLPDGSEREEDDIKVEYHPHSGRPTRTYRFEDYVRERPQSGVLDDQPWRPAFSCREDFEFAEIVHNAGLKKEQVETLLKIISGAALGTSSFSFRTYADLSNAWKKAALKQPSFTKRTIEVPYHGETRTYDVYVRDVQELVTQQLQDPNLVQYIQFDARRMTKWNGNYWEPFYESEPVTGSKMWDVQSNIPKDAKPLGLLIYADKNKLSSFGTQQGYPVVLRITNIETHVRHGNGLGGGHIIGFLPIVGEESGESGKTGFANFKREVWHAAMAAIVEPMAILSRMGLAVICGDAIRRLFYLFLHILSGDYEELCAMLLMRGNNSLYPCPLCRVPSDQLSNVLQEWPPRSASDAFTIFEHGLKGKRDEASKALGMRPIENVFWTIANSDPHDAASIDVMHMDKSGTFGYHQFGQFKLILKKLHRSFAARIDANIQAMPRWRGLNHFESGILTVDFTDASKYDDISKIIVVASYDVLTRTASPRGYSLLKFIRKYTECHMYLCLEVHTETTLNDFATVLAEFYTCLEDYRRFTDKDIKPKDWDFIKMHMRVHGPRDIRGKGTLVSTTTMTLEKFHGPMRKNYLNRTNFKDVIAQLARLDDRSFVVDVIRENIDLWDEFIKQRERDAADEDLSEPTPYQFSQIYLGSRQAGVSLQSVEERQAVDRAFVDFRTKLNVFLTELAAAHRVHLSIRLEPSFTLTECQFLKVKFESKCTGQEETDYLRCSPSFHGRPRYDGIIIEEAKDKYLFAQLVFMFICDMNDTKVPAALVLPMDKSIGPVQRIDTDLGICRLKASPRSDAIVIPLRSVKRGALLYQPDPYEQPDAFVVVDLVDSDMFLRCRSLFPKRHP